MARKVAIAPGGFEVNFSKVISCQILKVNICEQEGASKQTAVLGSQNNSFLSSSLVQSDASIAWKV